MTVPVRSRPLVTAAVAVLTLAGLAGCGGSDAYVGEDGDELAVGETASVEVDTDVASGPLDVTLDGVEAGDEADLSQLPQSNASGTPYYLRFTVENTDGSSFAGYRFGSADLGLVNGLDDGGSAMTSTINDETYEPCPNPELPAEFDETGAVQEVCVLVLGDGQEAVGANYIPGGVETTTVWLP